MKLNKIKSTSIKLLIKFLEEHPDEIFTVGELKEHGFTFYSSDLYKRIGDDHTYKAQKYRLYGCKAVIKELKDSNI